MKSSHLDCKFKGFLYIKPFRTNIPEQMALQIRAPSFLFHNSLKATQEIKLMLKPFFVSLKEKLLRESLFYYFILLFKCLSMIISNQRSGLHMLSPELFS
ncbi:hypothetical protein C4E44_14070 [Pseudomonas sp. MWU12-2312b]|nr:hypothetical protein C4E44_14070 [Pseudomonas sp. MWU12-2312b]